MQSTVTSTADYSGSKKRAQSIPIMKPKLRRLTMTAPWKLNEFSFAVLTTRFGVQTTHRRLRVDGEVGAQTEATLVAARTNWPPDNAKAKEVAREHRIQLRSRDIRA